MNIYGKITKDINMPAFDSPLKLLLWMKNNINYKEYSYLMTAEEVYKEKTGSCHDQVIFEMFYFEKMKIKYGTIFFIEYNDDNIGGATHSLLYYIKNGKYYWFENAWEEEKGIHGPYNSLKDLKDEVKEKDLKNSKYNNIEFGSIKNVKSGMTLNEFVQACLK